MAERTALINHLRSLLLERGIVATQGRKRLEAQLEVFADENDPRLSSRMRLLVEELHAEWRSLDERIVAVGDARRVGRGRDFAAWLGLTPRQATTGGKPRLLGISKRGNRYLRANLIDGARAVLPGLMAQYTSLGSWVRNLAPEH